jgi:predicted NUDIX family NTP pyrophosphohydrolase
MSRMRQFPEEIAPWLTLEEARGELDPAQLPLLEELAQRVARSAAR